MPYAIYDNPDDEDYARAMDEKARYETEEIHLTLMRCELEALKAILTRETNRCLWWDMTEKEAKEYCACQQIRTQIKDL